MFQTFQLHRELANCPKERSFSGLLMSFLLVPSAITKKIVRALQQLIDRWAHLDRRMACSDAISCRDVP